MASIIAMAVYDTAENNRTWMTEKTLESLKKTVNLVEHTLYIIDNGSCEATKKVIEDFSKDITSVIVITNEANVGTAKAINQAWKQRKKGQHLIKMDNDVVIHQSGWVELLEEAIAQQPKLGIVGLKRKDLAEHPNHPIGHHYKSNLIMLPHVPGKQWIVAEEVQHVMGTCQMYNSALIDKIGGLYQMDGIYGFDDSLAAIRCKMAGYMNVFLPSVNIDHIDPGQSQYTTWKEKYAAEHMALFSKIKAEYISGDREIYHAL